MQEADAAVAIVHAHEPEDSVLLIRRSEREDDPWSGHWSFPGGRRESRDADLLATALRELSEECGVELERSACEAALKPVPARRRVGQHLLVAPFVFHVDCQFATCLDPTEAVLSLWMPLAVLTDAARHCVQSIPGVPSEMLFPCIGLEGMPLWGFTYRLITQWLGLLPDSGAVERAGLEAANRLLGFLLTRGLTLVRGWEDRSAQGLAMTAVVQGEIPVAAVREFVRTSGSGIIPPVNVIELAPDHIRIAGLALEEYLIQASG